MLSLQSIEQYYPDNQKPFKRNILREYLQYKILEIIFNSKYAEELTFLGGTALRIVYNNSRFSEDLDFDNFTLTEEQFADLAQEVKKGLELQGYEVEIKNVFKGDIVRIFECQKCYLIIIYLICKRKRFSFKSTPSPKRLIIKKIVKL